MLSIWQVFLVSLKTGMIVFINYTNKFFKTVGAYSDDKKCKDYMYGKDCMEVCGYCVEDSNG